MLLYISLGQNSDSTKTDKILNLHRQKLLDKVQEKTKLSSGAGTYSGFTIIELCNTHYLAK